MSQWHWNQKWYVPHIMEVICIFSILVCILGIFTTYVVKKYAFMTRTLFLTHLCYKITVFGKIWWKFYVVNLRYLCSKTKFVGQNFFINKKIACVNIWTCKIYFAQFGQFLSLLQPSRWKKKLNKKYNRIFFF